MLYAILYTAAGWLEHRLHAHYQAATVIGTQLGRVAMRDYWRSGVYLNAAHEVHLRLDRMLAAESRRRQREWGRSGWTAPLLTAQDHGWTLLDALRAPWPGEQEVNRWVRHTWSPS